MNELLVVDSPKYLKRLVRELNREGGLNGFYASAATFNIRCNRARLRGGALEVHSPSCTPAWFSPARNSFTDAYGREIVASRR